MRSRSSTLGSRNCSDRCMDTFAAFVVFFGLVRTPLTIAEILSITPDDRPQTPSPSTLQMPRPRRRVSVSGQSAGANMAIQHLFAFSGNVDGAGIAAGSPYGCGAKPYAGRYKPCSYGEQFDQGPALKYIAQRVNDGLIDDVRNLSNTPVLLFNGKSDYVVYVKEMHQVAKQLEHFIKQDKLRSNFNTAAAHVWSIDHGPCACGACGWKTARTVCCNVNNCNYDLSGDMLRHIYGNSLRPRAVPRSVLHRVLQWDYVPVDSNITQHAYLMKWALVYVPTKCKADVDRCRVHVNYHGCTAKKMSLRSIWARQIGLNAYGEANDIVIVYPQVAGNQIAGNGCWNWSPYHQRKLKDPLFDTKKGAQLRTVTSMVDSLKEALLRGVEESVHTEADIRALESTLLEGELEVTDAAGDSAM
eukprot:TRINITY_DN4742_c0_g1_i1.p1 TRINITY_DN4742_c0_g1~~TRINITY_DN4742_c0_g1_i1.p1  ORF type:complete len:415 (+),score=46.58 TRINITY_DN4742_c0_g1_i1:55-1299(+)